MKSKKAVSLLFIMMLLIVSTIPTSAQLGDTDVSSFVVQNISTSTATVTVTFVSESGVEFTPLQLDNKTPTEIPNPFTLVAGASQNIFVPNVPAAQLPSGRYSVVISSNVQVAAVATVAGTGTRRFSGSYTGFSSGASPFYLPSAYFNFNGWYSMVSVQNLGASPANVTLTIKCENGATGTLTRNGIPSMASHTFALKNTTPDGFTSSTICRGSSELTSNQPIVAADNQSRPTGGNTLSIIGQSSGADKLYVPALYTNFSNWNSGLVIRKLTSGSTTVTIDYNDAEPNDTCALTDAVPFCLLYMPSYHPTSGAFGATITSSPAKDLAAVVNTTRGALSISYNGLSATNATGAVGVPSVYKEYYLWNSAFSCQNVGSVTTKIHVEYQNYAANAYDTGDLNPGDVYRRFQPDEAFLPNGYIGGVSLSAVTAGAKIACIVNLTNRNWENPSLPGDWSTGYNAFNK